MTVTATSYAPITYNGNGSTSVFNITFQFYEIAVIHIDSDGDETTWTENTHYTVTGGEGSTGSITVTTTAPATGEQLRIERKTPKNQKEDFDLDNEVLESSLQRSVDKMAMVIQEATYDAGRNFIATQAADEATARAQEAAASELAAAVSAQNASESEAQAESHAEDAFLWARQAEFNAEQAYANALADADGSVLSSFLIASTKSMTSHIFNDIYSQVMDLGGIEVSAPFEAEKTSSRRVSLSDQSTSLTFDLGGII